MRKRILFFVLFTVLISFLSSPALATRSRLMSMGDLSIVIEDESNMINLWDFGHNPAGFLQDERSSTVRMEMIRETYEIRDIEFYRFVPHFKFPIWYRCNAEGGSFKGNFSVTFRKKDRYALGLESNYLYRDREALDARTEIKYPEISFVLSKTLGSLTSIGANVQFRQYTTESSSELSHTSDNSKTKFSFADIGIGRRLSDMVTLALLLGYESLDPEYKFNLSDFYTIRASAQSIIEIENKMKLGIEVIGNIRRADFKYEYNGDDDYYYTQLKLRAIYNLTSRARLGILYLDKEHFSGYYYPINSFFNLSGIDALTFTHFGIGCAYDFADRVLVGLEYHLRDSSTPNFSHPQDGLMHWSVNLGIEGKLTQAFSVRTGYYWTASTRNPPVFVKSRDKTEEHVLTLGVGYQPTKLGLCFEFSYGYALKDFKHWYSVGYKYQSVESTRHTFSASLKLSF